MRQTEASQRMTELRARIKTAVDNADDPVSTLQLAGDLNTTIWQINRSVNTLEVAGEIEVLRRTNGVNKVRELESEDSEDNDTEKIVTDGGATNYAAQNYCKSCQCWRSIEDGDCFVCGRPLESEGSA
jgi:hypothetical protein